MLFGCREDTIYAVATGDVTAAISIIRLSGPASLSVLKQVFARPKGRGIDEKRSFRAWYGFVTDASGEMLDEVLALVMRGPRTFTGEDLVELQCHGGRIVRQRIMERLQEVGVRQAEAGEFTYRAFLNGRLDLTQAEGLDGVIRARSDMAAQRSLYQLQGSLQRRIHDLRANLLRCMAELEAQIDFPEDEVPARVTSETIGRVRTLTHDVRTLEESYRWGHLLRCGCPVVIAGRPNVGKSSLLNALVKRERALVSPGPGTTRDVIEESVCHQGMELLLRDTAGLRDTEEPVERMGTALAEKAIDESVIILYVVEADQARLTLDEEEWLARADEKKTLVVANKADLGRSLSPSLFGALSWVHTSAVRFEGIAELLDLVVEKVRAMGEGQLPGPVVTRPGQARRLGLARKELEAFQRALGTVPMDLALTHLYEGADHLGSITGEILREEILEEIFSQFCVGK